LSGSGCGSATSASAEVVVVADPSITVQPLTTQTVCQNGLSTPLTVTVTGGTGTTTYQWFTNPINSNVGGFASGNAATLTPITAVVGTAYVYCVINTTGVGCTSSASTTAEVIVVPIPTVTTQPLNTQTVCLNGATAALSFVYSNGTGTATYQWYSNAANSTTGGTAIAGETNASFTPPSATAGTTYYYCIATLSGSGCGTVTTATAAVIVVGLPTITAQPTVTQNICEGGTANPIAVSYSNGTGTASYQWFSNNSNATVGGIAIPGATADQYTIPSITLAGSYFYYAEITLSGSGCGTIASAASEVVVFLDPSVATEPLTTQSLCVNGAPTDLQVTFNNGAGTATYQWYSNNTNSNTGGVIIPSANNASYTPSTANSGTQYFYCEILLTGSGCELATSAAAEVVVVGLPTVSSQAISNETVCVDGTPSTLTPTLQGGTGTVSYQWYSNTTNDTTNGTTISGETNATYSPSATAVGATYYYLITTFSGTNCGSVTTNTSQVLVVADPTISIQPIATDSLCVGGTPVTLNVTISGGVGSPSYQWYSNTVNSNAGGTAVAGAGLDAFTPSSTSTVGSEFYYAEVTLSGSGCDAVSTTVSEIVSVADPIISTQPITTQNECLNAPTTALNATVSGGLGTISYAWYSNTTAVASGAIIPGANTNTVTPANTPVGTTYYYMVATLTGNGCDAAVSDFAEVIVNPLPNLTVTPVQDSICFGATTDVVASGAVDYVWTADPSITSPTDVAIVTVAPTGSVTYTVQGTDAVGCVNTASGVVFAATSLTVQEVITTDICFETCTGAIDLTPAGSIPNYSILWTDPAITGFTPQNLCPSTYDYTVTDALGCTFQNAVVISSLPNNPLDNAIVTQPTCFGFTNGSIEFVDTDAVSFELVNAATSASLATQPTGLFGNLGAGNYNVIYEDALGCVYDSLNFAVVELSAELTLTLNAQNPTLCYNEVVPLTAIAGGGDGGALTITWGSCNTVTNCIEGTGNPFDYTITSDVTLYAQASDANGCTSSIESIALNLTDPISVQMQNGISSVSICDGECVNMTAAASGGSSSPITIEWYEVPTAVGGTTIGPNGTSNSYCPTNTTSVFVYANDGCALPAYDTLNITVLPLPNVGFTVSEQNGCAPVTVSFTNTTSPALSASCIWTMDDGTTIPICGNQVYTYSEIGTYSPSLYVISADGCSATYTIPAPIEVYGYPTAEFTWAPEPADVLNPIVNFSNGSTDAVGYYWDFGPYGASIDENPIFTFPDEDLAEFPVCLIASNEFGCTDTACHTVTMNSVLQVWVPNAFTPEQDGLNEVFLPIIQGANPAGYHFMIFDRWGTLVFESFDIGTPWIGDIRGGKGFAPDGTYVWRLEVEHLADRRLGVYTGFVTLLR
jgi:PKD repeat protein